MQNQAPNYRPQPPPQTQASVSGQQGGPYQNTQAMRGQRNIPRPRYATAQNLMYQNIGPQTGMYTIQTGQLRMPTYTYSQTGGPVSSPHVAIQPQGQAHVIHSSQQPQYYHVPPFITMNNGIPQSTTHPQTAYYHQTTTSGTPVTYHQVPRLQLNASHMYTSQRPVHVSQIGQGAVNPQVHEMTQQQQKQIVHQHQTSNQQQVQQQQHQVQSQTIPHQPYTARVEQANAKSNAPQGTSGTPGHSKEIQPPAVREKRILCTINPTSGKNLLDAPESSGPSATATETPKDDKKSETPEVATSSKVLNSNTVTSDGFSESGQAGTAFQKKKILNIIDPATWEKVRNPLEPNTSSSFTEKGKEDKKPETLELNTEASSSVSGSKKLLERSKSLLMSKTKNSVFMKSLASYLDIKIPTITTTKENKREFKFSETIKERRKTHEINSPISPKQVSNDLFFDPDPDIMSRYELNVEDDLQYFTASDEEEFGEKSQKTISPIGSRPRSECTVGRKYDRECLLKLRSSPASNKNMPHIDLVEILKVTPDKNMGHSSKMDYKKSQQPMLSPKSPSPSLRSIDLKMNVKLKRAVDDWRLSQKSLSNFEVPVEPSSSQLYFDTVDWILIKAKRILTNLTVENFLRSCSRLSKLLDTGHHRLSPIVQLIFQMTNEKPESCSMYAQMIEQICKENQDILTRVRKIIVETFDKEMNEGDTEVNCDNNNRKDLVNVGLVGELYNLEILTIKRLTEYIQKLINHPQEENYLSVCQLLHIVGHKLNSTLKDQTRVASSQSVFIPEEQFMEKILERLRKFCEVSRLSSKTRLTILNTIEEFQRETHTIEEKVCGAEVDDQYSTLKMDDLTDSATRVKYKDSIAATVISKYQKPTPDLCTLARDILLVFLHTQKLELVMVLIKDKFPDERILLLVDTLVRQVGYMESEEELRTAGKLIKLFIKEKVISTEQVFEIICSRMIQVIKSLRGVYIHTRFFNFCVPTFILEIFGDELNFNWLLQLAEPLTVHPNLWEDYVKITLRLNVAKNNSILTWNDINPSIRKFLPTDCI